MVKMSRGSRTAHGETETEELASLARRYVIGALVLSVCVPLLPTAAWLVGGVPLMPRYLAALLTIGAGYLACVAVVATTCAVGGLRRFARDPGVRGLKSSRDPVETHTFQGLTNNAPASHRAQDKTRPAP